jgi:hypothetical protein
LFLVRWTRFREGVPADREEVLIRHEGIIELAIFDLARKKLILKNGGELSAAGEIQWAGLLDPLVAKRVR